MAVIGYLSQRLALSQKMLTKKAIRTLFQGLFLRMKLISLGTET